MFFAYIVDIDGYQVPLTAIQVLYINMITSVTMGLMLAMEPGEDDIMHRPPRRQGKRLFGKMVTPKLEPQTFSSLLCYFRA